MPHTLSCEQLGEADTENGSAVFGGIEVDRLSTAVVLLNPRCLAGMPGT
jgi:hypothetical protein